jgi:histidinol-phosphate aminotransferase
MSIVAIARPEIRSLTTYSSARMEAGGGAVMLNANELPWPPAGTTFNRYPDPQPAPLVEDFAHLYGVKKENVLIGRGSDEAIDLLVRAFCRAGDDAVAVCPPTFGMYAVCARVQNACVIEVPLTATFDVDVDALLAAVTPSCKLVFLCSPNNPTGNAIAIRDVERIAAALADRALVVVDEAYIEFSDAASAAMLLASHANIAVLRTLSKAYALAGTRIGCVLADAEVIALLRRIQAPYPLPTPCIDAALRALDRDARAQTNERVILIRRERERVAATLANSGAIVLPSVANFLCVRFADGPATYRYLLSQGIVVRNVGAYRGLKNCLRISVGAPEENDRLLRALVERSAAA